MEYKKPLIAVNHMEGHALIPRMNSFLQFPFLTILVSGGHTLILVCHDVGKYTQLGTTLDDAVGEVYDKVARMLGLEWDRGGGRALELAAREVTVSEAIPFPSPMILVKNCDFSFSGLKSSVKDFLATQDEEFLTLRRNVGRVSLGFELAVVKILVNRIRRALAWCRENGVNVSQAVFSGGVASNRHIRTAIDEVCAEAKVDLVLPPTHLCVDNAVMIAWAGLENYTRRLSTFTWEEAQSLEYAPRWPLDPSGVNHFPKSHLKSPRNKYAPPTHFSFLFIFQKCV